MVPPKKDVFSDLFNYAHGGSSKSSPSSSLHELSSKPLKAAQPKPTTFNENENANANAWTNLDVLSPNVVLNSASAASKPSNPINNTTQGKNTPGLGSLGVDDPFAVFATNSGSSSRKAEKTEDSCDPFEFFSVNSKEDSKKSGHSAREFPSGEEINQNGSEISRVDHALLDDEFTDAFSGTDPIEDSSNTAQRNSVSHHLEAASEESERDHVLAALMAEGFHIDIANQAISQVGPDLEQCVRLIVMSSVDSGRSSPIQSSRNRTSNWSSQNQPTPNPSSHRREPLANDLGEAFQDISQDLLKKATWLLDKSKKTVIKNINNFQNQRTRRDGNDMPAWISDQHKFKHQAIERRKDGSSYEDYGTDEDNIDTEEIRRIVQMQREKEIERQRQRLESLGRSKSPKQKNNTPTIQNGDVAPDSQKLQRSQQKPVQTPLAKVPRESIDSSRSNKPASISRPMALKNATPASSRGTPEEDLLGLGSMGTPALSRAQQFKQISQEETSYVSPARRRHATPSPVKRRSTSCEPLNTFAQSDYDTHKASGGSSFSAGDYDNALASYTKCLHSLPEKHELRIIITSNLALTAIKIGNYPLALQNCDEGLGLVGEHFTDPEWYINDKNIKYWYVRLLTRKAESLEMLENFEASLDCYMTLVTKLAVNDKKTMDAKSRVNNIVNPPKPTQKSKPIIADPVKPSSALASSKNLTQIKSRHKEEKLQEQKKFELHDIVHEKIHQWSDGKEANLRSLLMSLADILPQHLGYSFIAAKKITINDLMLTKKVKINYMKVISNIHPDKLGGLELEDQMICQGVFVALNKAWDEFKKQNNIT